MKKSLSVFIAVDLLLLRLRWTAQVHQCVFEDPSSSVAAVFFLAWVHRFSLGVSHSRSSAAIGFSLIHPRLCQQKWNVRQLRNNDNFSLKRQSCSGIVLYLCASFWRVLLTSIDLWLSTFSNCSFSCLSICTSRLLKEMSSWTDLIISWRRHKQC